MRHTLPNYFPRYLLLSVVVLSAAIVLVSIAFFRHQAAGSLRDTEQSLVTIATMKAGQIAGWMKERRGDAEVVRSSERIRQLLKNPDDPAARDSVRKYFATLRSSYDYDALAVFDSRGSLILATSESLPDRYGYLPEYVKRALHAKDNLVTDLHRSDPDGQIHFALLCPIRSAAQTDGPAQGVVLLLVDPSRFLFPFVKSWPAPSRTAETLLLRHDGATVEVLNDLRHLKNAALKLRLSAGQTETPEVRTVLLNERGVMSGKDYRGVPVVAAAFPIQGTAWFVLAKIDRAELDARSRKDAVLVGLLAIVLVSAMALGFYWLWRDRSMGMLQRESEQQFRVLFESSHDAIMILSPPSWRFTTVNPATVAMFGARDVAEFMAMAPWEYSPDCQPDGRLSAEKARMMIETAMQDGVCSFEWVHRRASGEEFPADVLLSRIELRGAPLIQATVRDITLLKLAEESFRAAEEAKFNLLLQGAPDGILIFDPASHSVQRGNAAICRMLGYTIEELTALRIEDLQPGKRLPQLYDLIVDSLRNGHSDLSDIPVKRKDGSVFFASLTALTFTSDSKHYITAFFRDITERKLASEALRQSEEKLRLTTSAARDAIIMIDDTGGITFWNEAAATMLGYTSDEVMGRNFHELIAPERYHLTHRQGFDEFRVSGRGNAIGRTLELMAIRKDGREIDVELSLSAARFDDQWHALGIMRDITERKQREEQLTALEMRFKAIFEGATDGIILADPATRSFRLCNETMCRLTGYSAEELCALGVADLHPAESLPVIIAGFEQQFRGESRVAHNLPVLRKDGSLFYADVGTALIPVDGSTYLAGFFRDVTERRQAEERLRRLNIAQTALHDHGSLDQKLKLITDAVVDIFHADFARIWLIGRGDRCDTGCVHAENTAGPHVCRDRKRCLHLTASSGRYTHLDGRGHARVPLGCYKIGRVAAGLDPSFLTNDVTRDPRVHDHEWAKQLGLISFAGFQLRPPHDETIGVMALFSQHAISPEEEALLKNISNLIAPVIQSARAEEALRESEEKYRGIFDESVAAVFVFNTGKRFVDTNQAGLDLLGYTREELLSLSISDVDADPDAMLPAPGELLSGGRLVNYEHRLRRKDGSIITVLNNSRALTGPDGCVTGMLSTLFNITLRKQLEEDLQARNEELIRFSYTVSHDLKSPLVTIRTFLGFLEKDLEKNDTERIRTDFDHIGRAATKMHSLLEELLELSRVGRKMNPPEEVLFADLVRSALDAVAGQIAERQVAIHLDPAPLLLHGDRPRLTEVFQNLIDNAVKFMGDQAAPCIEIGVECGSVPVFQVRDNGMGIDPRHMGKLFGLFEKLHPGTPGTGMGLALVKRIVEVHGGKIWAESAGPGQGTTFRFTLQGTKHQQERTDL